MIQLSKEYIAILWSYKTQSIYKQQAIKKLLMPEDDVDNLIFDVKTHPKIDTNGICVFNFADIIVLKQIQSELYTICEIYID